MKVTTKTKEFNIAIMGVSTYDDVLRIEIKNANLNVVFSVFSDPSETKTLVHDWDGVKTTLRGYTKFQSIDVMKNGNIIVALAKG